MPDAMPGTTSSPRRGRVPGPLLGFAALTAAVMAIVASLLLATGAPEPRLDPAHRGGGGAAARSGVSGGTRRGSGATAASPVDGQVTLARGRVSTRVPGSFLGVSTEYWTVPIWAGHMRLLRRVLALLSADGPVRLRIGGDSADRVIWAPRRELPEWVFELTPSWLAQTSRIVRTAHVKLILDLNLVTATPAAAARWARSAVNRLPTGSITAFEVGNEPDIYSRRAWLRITAGPGVPALPQRITAASYARSFLLYSRALSAAAPGVPLLAPALAEPQRNFGWVTTLLRAPHPDLAGITAHRYPYSACARPGSPTFPTIARILSEQATVSMGRTALTVERISDRARLPLWLTEINSVTCGGTRGVSDTFATALWAPDALMELVRAGVEAASVHVRADAINMAFSLTDRGLVAHPLFYGMLLFERALGPGAIMVPVHLSAPASRHLKAWAIRIDGGVMHVLLLDKGDRPARVRLRLALAGSASVQRLLAPTISSTAQVSLAGQHLTPAGTWAGRQRVQTVSPASGGYVIALPRYSAALVTARLRPGS